MDSIPLDRREEWENHKQAQLDLMRRYAYSVGCRQLSLMDYFGDKESLPQGCGRCDNCETPAAQTVDDRTQEAVRIVLSGAARLQGRFGANQLIDLVTGSDTAQIRRWGHHEFPTYGRLKDERKQRVQSLVQALIRQGYLHQEGLRYPIVSLTSEGEDVMLNRAQAKLSAWEPRERKKRDRRRTVDPSSTISLTEKDQDLRETLRAWRLQKSRAMGIPPYTLFWDRTLDELCQKRPQNDADLLTIWGIGEQKRRLFGSEILSIITAS